MPRPYASGIVPAAADQVWALVRDFNGLPAWHDAIATSEISDGGPASSAVWSVGSVRNLTLGDGGVVRERLVTLDDVDRSYTYDILESPFPVRSYRSTVRVAAVTATGQSFVEWWVEFDSDAADEQGLVKLFADGVFATGIAGLVRHFGG